ncbi:DUF2064 domain-containing protein [Bacteriovorax sp. PP10]|uniref:DUF2064 domain-containing protein n=1 Tax=Bacteriovorax antarcticus TaxID=3088717 RepID=A0ABU5VZG5_9BACT|nr:DUF2064 domain-containing protein [Bacteriovorax sp. PP10]MEA9358431.1 DUF2064 domain-containing protein [Bacteriovorax sp. PP10]
MDNLSVIIPVKSQDHCWEDLVNKLLSFEGKFEIILVGPDFKNMKSKTTRVRFEFCEQGRARQLNYGAQLATRKFLWFLHADSQLTNNSLQKIEEKILENNEAIYYFDLKFLQDGPSYMNLNNLGTYLRSHLLKMPFGDQGFFMAKSTFFSLGQFNQNAPYGEDHLLIWKAHQRQVEVLPAETTLYTSARKYQKNGWFKTTTRHLFLTYKQAAPEWLKCFTQKNKKRPTTAVAIFVKTPGVSTVKSRLAAHIGKDKAEEFFKLSLKATETVVMEAISKSEGSIEAYWAVAEPEQLSHPLWDSFKTVSQGTGDLGQRLDTVYAELQKKHDSVFLIGADLPHLNYELILNAQKLINSASPYVLGKTEDGGFYLFGGKNEISSSTWNSVAYSTEHTSADLIKSLGNSNFSFLDENFDIDNFQDLKNLSSYTKENLLSDQRIIINWAKTQLS